VSNREQAEGTEHPIATQLRQAGIVKAVIIDDAYDPPTRDVHLEEIAGFWIPLCATPGF